MSRLPSVKPRDIEKVLFKLGFVSRLGKGSHVVFKHPDGRRTVVPTHNRPVMVGTLRAILRQSEVTMEEFLRRLRE